MRNSPLARTPPKNLPNIPGMDGLLWIIEYDLMLQASPLGWERQSKPRQRILERRAQLAPLLPRLKMTSSQWISERCVHMLSSSGNNFTIKYFNTAMCSAICWTLVTVFYFDVYTCISCTSTLSIWFVSCLCHIASAKFITKTFVV